MQRISIPSASAARNTHALKQAAKLQHPTMHLTTRRTQFVYRCSPSDGQQSESQPRITETSAQQDSTEADGSSSDSATMFSSLNAISKLRGNRGSTHVLLASDNSDETWRRLDKRVNKYPAQRTFTAIGSGGSNFRTSMVSAVESVVGSVHCECVSERSSKAGNYTSVTVGPVWVENGDQVVAIFNAMKVDSRCKWLI